MTIAARPAQRWGVLAGGLVVLGGVLVVHLTRGAAPVRFDDLLDAALGRADLTARRVLVDSRLPRTVAGLLVGAATGMAGVLLQTVTRNPLAAPDTMGVNAGAYLAVVAVTVLGLPLTGLPAGGVALVGGAAAAVAVFGLSAGAGGGPTGLLLAGTAVTLAASSLAAVLLVLGEQRTGGLFFWGQGSLVQSGFERVAPMVPAVLVAGLVAWIGGRKLDVFEAGEDTARSLGVRVGTLRVGAVGLAVVLAAAGVAAAGPVGFLGLVAARLVRLAGLRRHRWLLPTAALWGALLILVADILAQQVVSPAFGEVPAGVFAALIGAPVFILLARRVPVGWFADTVGTARAATRRLPLVVVLPVVGATLLTTAAFALRIGDQPVSWGDLLGALTGADDLAAVIVAELRAPRVVVAVLAGASLAASGVLLQGVTGNPLAEPALLGISTGAGVGALLFLLVLPSAPAALVPIGAFVGAMLAFGLVVALSWRGGLVPQRVVLVGIGMWVLGLAVTNYIVVSSELQLAQALTWLSGTVYARDWDDATVLLAAVPPLVIALLATRTLDLVGLGPDTSRSLGLRLERSRLGLLVVAVLLAAIATAMVGPIAFVGLVAPHAARMLVGAPSRLVLPVAVLMGGLLVVSADAVGRTVIAPAEIPAGMLCSVLGAPFFGWLLWRSRATAV